MAKQKTRTKTPKPKKTSLSESLWLLLAEHRLDAISPDMLARHSGASKTEVEALLGDQTGLMRLLADDLTAGALQNYRHDPLSSPRDRLFEFMMLRFDSLQIRRAAISNLIQAAKHSPTLSLALLRAIAPQMSVILQKAQLPASPLHGPILLAAYLAVCRVWLKDSSPDLAATMAALDRHCGRLEHFAKLFGGAASHP
jgi:ubiquinone biosynthesis protein COQ9